MKNHDATPPSSPKVRDGLFGKWALPSGRWVHVHLWWHRQIKRWTFVPAPSEWTGLDREWMQHVIQPQILMKLNHCYDLIEPGWARKRAAAHQQATSYETLTLPERTEPEMARLQPPLSPQQLRLLLPRGT